MYMNAFTYRRPRTLDEARELFAGAESPSFMSGGHTLLPTMKNRLAAPDVLIDLRAIPDLHGITREDGRLVIGAGTPHAEVAKSSAVREAIPALAAMVGSIADPQVRHVGTMGGSVANNDPSADYPAAVLSLGATVITDQREIAADDYFQGLFTTALDEGEILLRIAFPIPDQAGYAKLRSQASRYSVAGCFVSRFDDRVRVAVTGAGNDGVFRWAEAEEALGRTFAPSAVADLLPDEGDMIADLNAGADYRANLVQAMTRRALETLGGAYIR